MIKNIIFDLDGTLLNTLYDLNTAINYMCDSLSFPRRTLEDTRNDIGDGIKMLVQRSMPKDKYPILFEEAFSLFKNYYGNHYMDKTKPYDGVKEVLDKLKENHYVLAVVSNKYHERTVPLVNHFFPNVFDMIQGQNDELRRKPFPDMVDNVINILNIKKEETIYVGDTEIDYLTATNSEITPLLVSYGYRDKSELLKIKENPQIVDSLLDILNII